MFTKASLNGIFPKEPLLFKWVLGSVIAALFILALLGAAYRHLPPQVPVFYSNPWGKQQLAPTYFLFLPQVLSLLLLVVNLSLAKTVFNSYALTRQILFVGSALVVLLSTITVSRIILLVS